MRDRLLKMMERIGAKTHCAGESNSVNYQTVEPPGSTRTGSTGHYTGTLLGKIETLLDEAGELGKE
jgi:hypothetical protein